MDKTAIKNFAVTARTKLKKAIEAKAYDIGVKPDKAEPITKVQGGFIYNEKSYSKEALAGREKLVNTITLRSEDKGYAHGFNQVVEEVAYTWFNRLIALRFMELNGYLPSNICILSSVDKDRKEPDCIREVDSLDFVDPTIVNGLIHDTENLYRYILIAQCNALADIMPRMFEKIADYTELLLPDRLYLQEGNIVYDLVHGIEEENFTEQVEIIGWLYQFYISEKKDEVFAALKKNVKITKENIPAATQLFTPEWIVKYMVENSLGRIAVEKLNLDPTEMGWRYYLPEAEQTEEVKQQLLLINGDKADFDIKSVKLIDPCMGSGHILVYAFDVLQQIYEKLGYSSREIPNYILNNNLFGLDIDDRAGQLAYFALMMKARSHNRRFFRQTDEEGNLHIPQPRVYSVKDTKSVKKAHLSYMGGSFKDETQRKAVLTDLEHIISTFENAKEYGSLLDCSKAVDFEKLYSFIGNYTVSQFDMTSLGIDETKNSLFELIGLYFLMHQKYDVVMTNPPYMGGSGMGAKLSDFVKKEYPNSKSDLFAVFIEKCGQMLKIGGTQAMITQHAWMFLSSYEKLRAKVMSKDILTMAHLGARAFEEIGGEVVQTTAFVMRNSNVKGYQGSYVRLVDFNSQQAKEEAFLSGDNRHTAQKENFEKIPGIPVAYWVSKKLLIAFENKLLREYGEPKQGFATGNNDVFLRLWHEVSKSNTSILIAESDNAKWYPCNKGGTYRRWYGNNNFVANWENDGVAMRSYSGSVIRNPQYYFREGLTWSTIANSLSMRFSPQGFVFETKGSVCFINSSEKIKYILGLLNSKIIEKFLLVLSPTLDFHEGPIGRIPVIYLDADLDNINKCVSENISIAKTDWDSFETSWDFKWHPFMNWIAKGGWGDDESNWSATIEESFEYWQEYTERRFNELKSNEEELNRIFIDIYGLQDELTPEVKDKDVTIRKADLVRDIKSFISYAVGCMFGRYSPVKDGLIFAGGQWDYEKIQQELFDAIGKNDFTGRDFVWNSNFIDKDNILPITDNDYFDDDIVTRFFRFVEAVYGAETLGQNLEFIADALYPNASGTAREKIRKYFVNDFYKDHVKIYQKKPIYWQFDSGKQNGFKALVYLHRYDKYNVARLRTDYLHPLQRKYEAELKRLEMLSGMTENAKEKAQYRKDMERIDKQLSECRAYDPALAHIAHQSIELDLDDGVTVNYAKFMGIEVGSNKAVDLLTKI